MGVRGIMSQNQKEHLLTASVADSELRCRQEFERWSGAHSSLTEAGRYVEPAHQIAWNAWVACWMFLRSQAEEWART